jgi:hypothetical protein
MPIAAQSGHENTGGTRKRDRRRVRTVNSGRSGPGDSFRIGSSKEGTGLKQTGQAIPLNPGALPDVRTHGRDRRLDCKRERIAIDARADAREMLW